MSKFTDFLNLFKWDSIENSEEEFDIDKALNDNWDKIDNKLKTYITDTDNKIGTFEETVNSDIEDFKEEINQSINTFESNTNKTVQDLRDSISATQEFHKYYLNIETAVSAGGTVTLPCYYKVGQGVLDVYCCGERLLLSSDDAGTDGHYVEVGDTDSISNQIKITTDCSLDVGDYLELVVRGEFSV